MNPSAHIVVGIDGSDGSDAALDHACEEAALRGLAVLAVAVWEPPDLWVTSKGLVPPATELHRAALADAHEQVANAASRRVGRSAMPVEVTVEAHSGPAAVVLERLSRGAAMLVVGHRGRGAVASRLIGSVGLSCVLHASCTVVVVRPAVS